MTTAPPASEADLVGKVLGKWRIMRPLARGGFGVVYEAQHTAIAGHRAAVKVLHSLHSADPEIQRRFTSEANAASSIAHPNIVKIFDAGVTAQGTCYIAMEFLDGKPLSALIKQGGLTPARTAYLLAQVASAVGAAHGRGIVHRDLKPDNIIVIRVPGASAQSDELVKVLDFGIAKLANETGHTQTGALLGTPFYMSPEQWQADKNLDGRADIYALGIILFECLTSRRPFECESPLQYMYAHVQRPMPDLAEFGTFPEPLRQLVGRMAQKQVADRPATMQQVETELRYIAGLDSAAVSGLEGLGATLPLSGTPAAMPAMGPSRRPPVAIAAAGLVLLACVTAGLFWRRGHTGVKIPAKDEASPTPAIAAPDLGAPSLPPELVVLGPSRFAIGTGPATAEDGPPHPVLIERFALSRFEVRFSELAEYQASVGHPLTALQGISLEKFGSRPAVNLTRDEAAAYCRWRYARWDGRLPTELEWEFAARSGDATRLYPWAGTRIEPAMANLGALHPRTFPVESFEAGVSVQGLFHLIGNAAEWTASDSAPYPGSSARVAAGLAVVRGGGASTPVARVRATSRFFVPATSGNPFLGFRCAARP